jgi:hypothetical protein
MKGGTQTARLSQSSDPRIINTVLRDSVIAHAPSA